MGTYEPCVLGSDGNCTRWSHDHAADRPSVEDARAAEVLAAHQRQSIGMTASSPDHCSCGEAVPPEPDLTTSGPAPTIEGRRYRAFAAHQAAALAAGRAETTTATTEDIHALDARWFERWETEQPLADKHAGYYQGRVSAIAQCREELRGLLATARTRPTRQHALKKAYRDRQQPIQEDDAWAFGEGVRAGVDAVLALLADQPTEAEAGARALEQAADTLGTRGRMSPQALRDRAADLRGGDER